MAKSRESQLEERYEKLRSERRELEAELAGIDSRMQQAVRDGDAPTLGTLKRRKTELPELFITASASETSARREWLATEDKRNQERLATCAAEHAELKAAYAKRQAEVVRELSAMEAGVYEAARLVGAMYVTIAGRRQVEGAGETGYQNSLARLAAV